MIEHLLWVLFMVPMYSKETVGPQVLAGQTENIPNYNLIKLVNKERSIRGLNTLTYNTILSQSARSKACDILNKRYWAHTSPSGKLAWAWFQESGYHYVYAGENLAKDFSTDKEVVDAWMNSSTHRENILHPKYKDIGIGKCGNIIAMHVGVR